jgi:hypothetical protein
MSDQPHESARPLIGFVTGDRAPTFTPGAITRPWMAGMRRGWANRCLPMLIANQSGRGLRNPSGFTATWMGGDDPAKATVAPDAISPLEGIVETDWARSAFSINWKFTREFMPVRVEIDEPICTIVSQRRGELEEFTPEFRPIASDDDAHRRQESFILSHQELGQAQAATDTTVSDKVPWQGDDTRGVHANGEAGAPDHRTRRGLRPFVQPPDEQVH